MKFAVKTLILGFPWLLSALFLLSVVMNEASKRTILVMKKPKGDEISSLIPLFFF